MHDVLEAAGQEEDAATEDSEAPAQQVFDKEGEMEDDDNGHDVEEIVQMRVKPGSNPDGLLQGLVRWGGYTEEA